MTFAYDLTTDRGKVRLNLGDTQENAGPRPDKRNFSDAEIDYLLSAESSVIVAATAFGFEILASEWASFAISEREGEAQYDAKGMADVYSGLANDWRSKPGGGDSSNTLSGGVITLDFMEKIPESET